MSSQSTIVPDPNSVADTARASIVYSMVPYLGILFVPVALAASTYGFTRSASPYRRRFLLCAAASFLVLAVQLLLWWLLYLIPKLGVLR